MLTRIERLLENAEAISCNLDTERYIALDRGNTNDVECEGEIIRGEDDIEQTGREARVVLTRIKGLGLDQSKAGCAGEEG